MVRPLSSSPVSSFANALPGVPARRSRHGLGHPESQMPNINDEDEDTGPFVPTAPRHPPDRSTQPPTPLKSAPLGRGRGHPIMPAAPRHSPIILSLTESPNGGVPPPHPSFQLPLKIRGSQKRHSRYCRHALQSLNPAVADVLYPRDFEQEKQTTGSRWTGSLRIWRRTLGQQI
jgi:hypothetical protein